MTAISFMLRTLDTGTTIGAAVVCVEARYCSVLWHGADRVERRSVESDAWYVIEKEIAAGFEAGLVAAVTALAEMMIGERTSEVTIQQLSAFPLDVTTALDALLLATAGPRLALEHICAKGWVCEAHPGRGFPHGDDCGGPGMPCPVCNADGARRPTFDELWASTDDEPNEGGS